MLRLLLPLSIWFVLAGSEGNLNAQGTVENAMGAARAATTTAPAGNIGKAMTGIAGALDGALKGARGVGTNSSSSTVQQTVRPTTARGTDIQAPKPGSNFEDPLQIQTGMSYEDVLRRFGPPKLQITDGPDTTSLAYSSKDGGVKVEMQDGKVASVERPKS